MDTHMPDNNLPTDDQIRTPGAHAERPVHRQHRVGRALASVGLVASGALGGFVSAELQDAHHEISDVQQTPELNARVQLDIAAAVEADTCQTRVTVEGVSAIYQRLFGTQTEGLQGKDIESAAKNTIKHTLEISKKMDIADDPVASQFLAQEYANHFSSSYAQYKKVFEDYLKPLGLQLVDNWSKDPSLKERFIEDGISQTTSQLKHSDKTDSYSVKTQILRTIEGMSKMPTRLIRESGLQYIILGVSRDGSYEGMAFSRSDTRAIALAASRGKANTVQEAYTIHGPDTIGHETAHIYDDMLCAAFAGNYVDDESLVSLNRTFRYGNRSKKALAKENLVDNQFTTLDNSSVIAQAVVTDAYGATNSLEDKATLMGGNMFYTPSIVNIVKNGAADPTIVHEKLAYLLARIQKKDPELAEYYVSMIKTAEQAQIVQDYASGIIKRVESYQRGSVYAYDTPFRAAEELEAKKYFDLSSKLFSLLYSAGQTTEYPLK